MKHFADKGEKIFRAVLSKLPAIEQLMEVLEIPFKVTTALQCEKFVLSDFYGLWLEMTLKLNMIENIEFSTILIQKLQNRKGQLLDHPAMLCALFLDPRYNQEMSYEQKEEARKLLKSLWFRLKSIKPNEESEDNGIDFLEQYFLSKGQEPVGGNNRTQSESDFDSQLH